MVSPTDFHFLRLHTDSIRSRSIWAGNVFYEIPQIKTTIHENCCFNTYLQLTLLLFVSLCQLEQQKFDVIEPHVCKMF